MKRHKVHSSCVKSVGYDFYESILEIEFTNNTLYRYLDYPYSLYKEFLLATSKGKFFNEVIRDNYEYEKIH